MNAVWNNAEQTLELMPDDKDEQGYIRALLARREITLTVLDVEEWTADESSPTFIRKVVLGLKV